MQGIVVLMQRNDRHFDVNVDGRVEEWKKAQNL
jgi:hypothetical protein